MKPFAIIFICTLFFGCTHKFQNQNNVKIFDVADVNWEKLNPARGNKSPQAGTLWGDRKGTPATGFLAKFVDGFSSPPHIHNVSYRAIVIEGLIHNDDPSAAKMWMPQGSYWTQPAGESHITAAKGKTNIIYVEIDNGPYLVKPAEMNFDNGERPFNIHTSNIIWRKKENYSTAPLWKNKTGKVIGSLIKFNGVLKLDVENSKIVLINGVTLIQNKTLKPGSLISISRKSNIHLTCKLNECILYLRAD
jgi:hypothetical protein